MKKVYHLSSCNTCQKILKELNLPDSFEIQDIKEEEITKEQLEEMEALAGSYEALFSRRARLYRERELNKKELSEADYKELILDHYTFLKRPVIINNDEIFIGNSKKTVAAAKAAVHG
ncbi:arsenate reductase family protein [Salegentibacter mishustinae]|jgi:arsenate reductase|uniref:Arsenate reductase n=1 Tax=Salegentibacter mishustinae TaxID=270918 RepID=A0A0Q9ZAG0_9FLAO|nr:ArsC/Spx/MgsR family protein [Salegentibacter mishustinae]KRG29999.1 arsenate reductase [Salegentibacter mishustinae]MDX1426545.1 ArsC/Spx/MgsR family protein [Salegentibacter mishustinae]PNW20595.1 arsenate reductase [Salegentibacter mishustinae]PZX61603.1 arsenate reductase [Salegentibacter mishustinae]GGW98853.1 arsenate reductase [Salegentibacter mishustinae]|tara:strand:- start:328 stop:681 length:354 start_codon:yes stop_codon:yes gene_type:complete